MVNRIVPAGTAATRTVGRSPLRLNAPSRIATRSSSLEFALRSMRTAAPRLASADTKKSFNSEIARGSGSFAPSRKRTACVRVETLTTGRLRISPARSSTRVDGAVVTSVAHPESQNAVATALNTTLKLMANPSLPERRASGVREGSACNRLPSGCAPRLSEPHSRPWEPPASGCWGGRGRGLR